MLVKGSARGGPGSLARHLEAEDNERVTIIGIQGLGARDLEGALIEMDALGAELKTHRTLYHMSINPEPGKDREMREADWAYAAKTALKKMGLEGQPYIYIEHEKFGKDGALRRHRHLVASRADVENMRAIRADHNYRKHEEIARDVERHLGHAKVQGAHVEREGEERPDRTPTHAEMQQAKRGAVSRDDAKSFITKLWQTTDSATALQAALAANGWMLARGDKTTAKGRAYLMVLDPQGGLHELARRVEGVKAAAVHERMAALDPAGLPSMDEARALQKAREPDSQVKPQQPEIPSGKTAPMHDEPDATKQPANQNQPGFQPTAVGASVPLSFAPETIAATSPAEIERGLKAMQAEVEREAKRDPWGSIEAAQNKGEPLHPAAIEAVERIVAKAEIFKRDEQFAEFYCATEHLIHSGILGKLHDQAPEPAAIERAETFEEMDDRHRDEWELVHGAYGVEELPAQLSARQAEERVRLAWQQPAFSADTIAADPWTAVYLPIPADADHLLQLRAQKAASHCTYMLTKDVNNGPAVPQGDTLTQMVTKAVERRDELEHMLGLHNAPANQNHPEHIALVTTETVTASADVREAWTQPAFDSSTINADPWTAVYLPAPENASPALLNAAYNAAARCIEAIEKPGIELPYADAIMHAPRIAQGNDRLTDNLARAEQRRDELHAMLYPIGAPAAGQEKRERIAALEETAHVAAQEMFNVAPEPHRPDIAIPAPTEPLQADMPPAAPTPPEPATTATGAAHSPAQQAFTPDPVREFEDDALTFLDRAERAGRRFLEGIADRFEGFIHFLADAVSPAPPPTRAQVEIAAEVADERAQEHADLTAALAREMEYDWRQSQTTQAQQTEDIALANLYGGPATREATLADRAHAHGRDHDYERD